MFYCSTPVSISWPVHTGDILRLKAFVYNVCTVRTGVAPPKKKFSTHGALKQTGDMLSLNTPDRCGSSSPHSEHASQFWNQE
ncbi:hypothetical protein TNCV_4895311 [Trichonephila clavipes]|nr:hypothetical protein TNCV_4895311 [Trichonephila clavipes]